MPAVTMTQADRATPAQRAAPAEAPGTSGIAADAAGAHVPALDGIRGLAILAVVVHNAGYVAHGPADGLALKLLHTITGAGWVGVQLFFALSGFLITGILLETRGRPGWLRAFYGRRALRIVPLSYAALLAYLVVLPAVLGPASVLPADRGDSWWYWTYLSNWRLDTTGSSALSHFWSLAVEEQFYLAWPLVVLLVAPRRLVGTCIALAVAALAFRVGAHAFVEPERVASTLAYQGTVARWDALVLGALAALAAASSRARGWPVHDVRRAARGALATGLALLGLAALNRGFHSGGLLAQTVGQSLLAVASAALVLLVAGQHATGHGTVTRLLATAWLRWLGRYSYGLYVLHLFVHRAGEAWIGERLVRGGATWRAMATVGYAAAVLAVSCVLALLSWRLLEAPMLRLKRHFLVVR